MPGHHVMCGNMCHGNNNQPKIHPKGMATLKKKKDQSTTKKSLKKLNYIVKLFLLQVLLFFRIIHHEFSQF